MPTIEEIQQETQELMRQVLGNMLCIGTNGFNMEYSNGVTGKTYTVTLAIMETGEKEDNE